MKPSHALATAATVAALMLLGGCDLAKPLRPPPRHEPSLSSAAPSLPRSTTRAFETRATDHPAR